VLAELGAVEQRYRAVLEVLEEGVSVTGVARRSGVVRQTVRGWLRRYAEDGMGGLADRPSRPASCPHQMPAATEARIVAMRREHPGWGPSRIRWELERAGVVPLPGRSAVYRALVRHGLVAARKRPAAGGLPAVGTAAGDGLVADGRGGPGLRGRRRRGQDRDRDR
jgi:transposase-like protein